MAEQEQAQLELLRTFADLAALAGVRGEIQDDEFAAGFELEGGRTQVVYVRPLPEAVNGKDAVCIYSPCRIIKKRLLRGLAKGQALELLMLNSTIMFARYGVVENEEEIRVMASVDCMLDTLDPSELEAFFWYVAIAADNYEKQFGDDVF